MRLDKVLLVLAWVSLVGYAVSSLWRKHSIAAYERYPPESIHWFWLRVFDLPHTRENCLRLHNVARWLMIFLTTVGTLAVLMWGE